MTWHLNYTIFVRPLTAKGGQCSKAVYRETAHKWCIPRKLNADVILTVKIVADTLGVGIVDLVRNI